MNKIFIINGTGKSGKDTFVKFVSTYYPNTVNFSSVDFIRWWLQKLGIDVEDKTPQLRYLISSIKKLLVEHGDIPLKNTLHVIQSLKPGQALFLHIREKEEIEKLKKIYPEIKTVLVKNDAVEKILGNESDDNVESIDYDITIYNNWHLEDLNKTAKWFTKTYVLEGEG